MTKALRSCHGGHPHIRIRDVEREDSDAIDFASERPGDLPASKLEPPAGDQKAIRSRAASNAIGGYRHPY